MRKNCIINRLQGTISVALADSLGLKHHQSKNFKEHLSKKSLLPLTCLPHLNIRSISWSSRSSFCRLMKNRIVSSWVKDIINWGGYTLRRISTVKLWRSSSGPSIILMRWTSTASEWPMFTFNWGGPMFRCNRQNERYRHWSVAGM